MPSAPLLVALLGGALLAAGSMGCGTSREPLYYAMGPVAGAPVRVDASPTIELRAPEVAGYLDRSDIVGSVVDHRLRIRSNAAWAEPLDGMIDRVLAVDLRSRLAGATVLRESESSGGRADSVVSVDVDRFDKGEDGRVVLVAQIAISRADAKKTVVRDVVLRASPAGGDVAHMVDTMGSLVGQLADQIASMVVASSVAGAADGSAVTEAMPSGPASGPPASGQPRHGGCSN